MIASLAFAMLMAFVASRCCSKLRLPPLLGMLMVGILMGKSFHLWLPETWQVFWASIALSSDVYQYSGELRGVALVLILLRAGMGIHAEELRAVGAPALKMSAVPMALEALAVTGMSMLFFGFTWLESMLLAMVISAVSPAVIVPKMLELMNEGWGRGKKIPTLILAGASLDDVLAITIFGLLLQASGESSNLLGWLAIHGPLSVGLGVLSGMALGAVVVVILRRLRWNGAETAMVLLLVALVFRGFESQSEWPVNALLAVMTLGFWVRHRLKDQVEHTSNVLKSMWLMAQLALFVLIGAEVDLGVLASVGWTGALILIVGLLFRSLGVAMSLMGTSLSFRERLFCAIAYVPKATVQAAIGGVVLEMVQKDSLSLVHGQSCAEVILAMAVLSILITAPLGAWAMDRTAHRLLQRF